MTTINLAAPPEGHEAFTAAIDPTRVVIVGAGSHAHEISVMLRDRLRGTGECVVIVDEASPVIAEPPPSINLTGRMHGRASLARMVALALMSAPRAVAEPASFALPSARNGDNTAQWKRERAGRGRR